MTQGFPPESGTVLSLDLLFYSNSYTRRVRSSGKAREMPTRLTAHGSRLTAHGSTGGHGPSMYNQKDPPPTFARYIKSS